MRGNAGYGVMICSYSLLKGRFDLLVDAIAFRKKILFVVTALAGGC